MKYTFANKIVILLVVFLLAFAAAGCLGGAEEDPADDNGLEIGERLDGEEGETDQEQDIAQDFEMQEPAVEVSPYEEREPTSDIAYFDFNIVAQNHPAIHRAQLEMQERQAEIMDEMEGMSQEEQMAQQQALQQQMQVLQQEIYERAVNEIRVDMQELADTMGYSYIVEEGAMFHGGDDITAEVIDYIQRELKD